MLNLKRKDPVKVDVEGQAVWVHPLTAGQHSQLVHSTKHQESWRANFLLLHFCCKHADASHCFPTVADAEAMTVETFNALIGVAMDQSGLGWEQSEKKEQPCETTTP